jgi:alpha-beta hydrolase superfamily lysophospholipase
VQSATRTFVASDGTSLHVYEWRPEDAARAAVEIAHGMGEHALRYEEVARSLCDAGYAVYAPDLRGHGRTAASDLLGDLGEDGWNRCVQDLREINDLIAAEHPDVPRILLGHSMGSLLAQQYLCEHGESLSAAVLSGSSWGRPHAADIGWYCASRTLAPGTGGG